MRCLAALALGFVLGACFFNVLTARQLEELHAQCLDLTEQKKAADDEIAHLKDNLAIESHHAISSVEPRIMLINSKLSAVETRAVTSAIRQMVLEVLAPLKGQEIQNLNPDLIPGMIDGRTVKVDRNEYVLQVTLLVVSDHVLVQVQAEQQSTRGAPLE